MNNSTKNHEILISKVISVFSRCNITKSEDSKIYFKRTTSLKKYSHFELHGVTENPLNIRTAYAHDKSSNQASSAIYGLSKVKGNVIFIYDGQGWKNDSYRNALYEIKLRIGRDKVFDLKAFEQWLKGQIQITY